MTTTLQSPIVPTFGSAELSGASRPHPVLRGALVAGGTAAIGAGVAATLAASVGVSPLDALIAAIAGRLGVGIGWVAAAIPLGFVVAGMLGGRRPGPGTIATHLGTGLVLGATLAVLPTPDPTVVRWSMFAVGFAVLVAGVVAVARAEAGLPGIEMFVFAACDRGASMRAVRLGIDLTALAGAVMLGGPVGAGTVLFGVASGPVITFAMRRWGPRH